MISCLRQTKCSRTIRKQALWRQAAWGLNAGFRGTSRKYSQRQNEVAKHDKYMPKLDPPRVSYEYPIEPQNDQSSRKVRISSNKHIKYLIGVFGVAYVGFALFNLRDFWHERPDQQCLRPDAWVKYKLTHKEQICDDLYLIELSPNALAQENISEKELGRMWDGSRFWSIEVKQPEIQVARKYTPLPLCYLQYISMNDRSIKSVLRIHTDDGEDRGRFVLLVKKYDQGEVSRWLVSQPVGSFIEIRGPLEEYKFPYGSAGKLPVRQTMCDVPSRMEPELPFSRDALAINPPRTAFFAAGTGITPILQSLWSRNPPLGFTDVYFSVPDRNHIPFKRFLYFTEKAGRAKFHIRSDDESPLTLKDIPDPPAKQNNPSPQLADKPDYKALRKQVKKFSSILEQVYLGFTPGIHVPPSLAIVCGPSGYVTFVSGQRETSSPGAKCGLLTQKGWTDEVVRLKS